MNEDIQMIRPRELCRILGISMATLYRWHSDGDIPIKKFRFGKSAVGYRKKDVEAWLEERQNSQK